MSFTNRHRTGEGAPNFICPVFHKGKINGQTDTGLAHEPISPPNGSADLYRKAEREKDAEVATSGVVGRECLVAIAGLHVTHTVPWYCLRKYFAMALGCTWKGRTQKLAAWAGSPRMGLEQHRGASASSQIW